ncbi:DUF4123 domain-containing protein [Variovorax robiniae]|uniref:DUF4123 domain-containing protein n=1 Tax=Variovorax robiniae TaxID=1836199 RepID=A0ABU8XC12_9BURK
MQSLDPSLLSEGDALPAPSRELVTLCHELMLHADIDSGRPRRAYLLLDRWQANPLASAFEARYPEQAAARCAVPDPMFKGREHDAPCLVQLPDDSWHREPGGASAQVFAQEWLAGLLGVAWDASLQRLSRQHFCAVLLSKAGPKAISRHLARLGDQWPEGASTLRLFRYHDARVMQRVWPTLAPAQQRCWLGPIDQWWALRQPWGAWTLEEDDERARWQVRWFGPNEAPPKSPSQLDIRRLFNATQWAMAHVAPVGNRVWARCAQRGIAVQNQPDGEAMDRLLKQGIASRLSDEDLENFVWRGWQIEKSEGEK